jgi:hypothetical protein
MRRALNWIRGQWRDLREYIAYRRLRRARIRSARKEDPNNYPLW